MCEVYEKGLCLGCCGLDISVNIDKVKKQCDTYKKFMGDYEQIEFENKIGGKINVKNINIINNYSC